MSPGAGDRFSRRGRIRRLSMISPSGRGLSFSFLCSPASPDIPGDAAMAEESNKTSRREGNRIRDNGYRGWNQRTFSEVDPPPPVWLKRFRFPFLVSFPLTEQRREHKGMQKKRKRTCSAAVHRRPDQLSERDGDGGLLTAGRKREKGGVKVSDKKKMRQLDFICVLSISFRLKKRMMEVMIVLLKACWEHQSAGPDRLSWRTIHHLHRPKMARMNQCHSQSEDKTVINRKMNWDYQEGKSLHGNISWEDNTISGRPPSQKPEPKLTALGR